MRSEPKAAEQSRGRPVSGKSRAEIVREAKARYRARLKEEGKVVVTLPIATELNECIREEAESRGRTATALMTELLEEAFHNRVPVQYSIPRRKENDAPQNERDRLYARFADKLIVNPLLTRKIVSFQASKTTPFYRRLKYKEAFSPELVDYLFDVVTTGDRRPLHVLDPFAGTGTVLTRASARGWKATGIELLPVGVHALNARFAADRVDREAFPSVRNYLALE